MSSKSNLLPACALGCAAFLAWPALAGNEAKTAAVKAVQPIQMQKPVVKQEPIARPMPKPIAEQPIVKPSPIGEPIVIKAPRPDPVVKPGLPHTDQKPGPIVIRERPEKPIDAKTDPRAMPKPIADPRAPQGPKQPGGDRKLPDGPMISPLQDAEKQVDNLAVQEKMSQMQNDEAVRGSQQSKKSSDASSDHIRKP